MTTSSRGKTVKAHRKTPGDRIAKSAIPTRTVRLTGGKAARMIRDAIAAGGELWVSGTGTSMHPTIRDADPVLLAPVRREVRRGDVVLVPIGARLTLHRVISVGEEFLRTRGDARNVLDPPTLRHDVVARAIAVRTNQDLVPLAGTWRFGGRPLLRFLVRELRRRLRAAIDSDRTSS